LKLGRRGWPQGPGRARIDLFPTIGAELLKIKRLFVTGA
jgi:hypothetical protein